MLGVAGEISGSRFIASTVKKGEKRMVTMQVPNFCTITQVCKELGFTYYTVSYWLDHNFDMLQKRHFYARLLI